MSTITLSSSPPMRPLRMLLGVTALLTLVFEIALLSYGFDAQAVAEVADLSPWQQAFAYAGHVAKMGVLGLVVAFVLLKDRLVYYWRRLHDAIIGRRFLAFWLLNLCSYALLFALSGEIFDAQSTASELSSFAYIAWLVLAVATLIFSAVSVASPRLIGEFLRAEYVPLGIASVIALVVWVLSVESQNLWGPMAQWTFATSAFLLGLMSRQPLIVLPDEKTLGLGDFAVNVAPVCSGYEGIALITAFTALYLYVHRDDLRFPKALVLFPVGAIAIWFLNSVRIAVLVAIGHYWSPEVAVGGFHSQAGWISFIAASLLMLWLIGGVAFFQKSQRKPQTASLDVATGTLVPIIVLLAATLLTEALSADFSWLYPLRVVAVAIAIYFVQRHIKLHLGELSWVSLAVGILVAVLWVLMLSSDPVYNDEFSAALSNVPVFWSGAWLFFRFIGAAITVPIAEELAFRGYLLSRLSRTEVVINGRLRASLFAVIVSSVAFGVLHGAWLAGTVAGIAYAVVRLRSTAISDAVVAHAVTNAAIFAYVLATGDWFLL